MEPVHQFSNRAGFFDLVGCTITDILPRYVNIIATYIYAKLPKILSVVKYEVVGTSYIEDAG